MLKQLSKLDSFAEQVTFNFRGSDKYRTARGGVVTIIVYAVIAWQAFLLLTQYVTQVDPTIKAYDIHYEPEEIHLEKYRQHLSFYIFNRLTDDLKDQNRLDPRAGVLSASLKYYEDLKIWDVKDKVDLKLVECSPE